MTMELAPASTSSSYPSTDGPRDDPSKLHLFRFESASDVFGPLQYKDKEEAAAVSPTESGHTSSTSDGGGNRDVLSSSNQGAHERQETTETLDLGPQARASKGHTTVSSSHSHRRKNSIEMFLSQSPSQALGGDFLKLSLDDRQMKELHARRPGMNGSTSARATHQNHVYATGHFQLNARSDDALPSRLRPPPRPPTAGLAVPQQLPPSLARVSPVSGNESAYTVHPPLADSWSTQDSGNQSMYYESMHEYYGHNHVTRSYSPEQHYGHIPQAYGYSHTPTRVQLVAGQWNPLMVGVPPPPPLYAGSSNMSMHSRSSPMRHPMDYMSQQVMRHPPGRTHGRNMYARVPPPLPEASPPQSPRKGMGMHLGSKQCKFFVQGHCRMGNKCKFVHQACTLTPELVHPGSVRTTSSMLYPQRMMPSHMMPPQRHQGEDAAFPSTRSQPRMGYRAEVPSGDRLNAALMRANASMLGKCTTDLSTMSAALSVEDIRNCVFAMSKDQNGCRLLQEQLDHEGRTDVCDVIYQESLDHLAEMMVDPFGNYLFQKLLEWVSDDRRVVIVRRVSSHLVAAALNLHGTRSVQKVVEVCAMARHEVMLVAQEKLYDKEREKSCTMDLSSVIVDALKDDAVRLCIDSNGNHVIQRALHCMTPERNQFVFEAVCRECTTVGTHRHGCCVLQRCVDAANPMQKQAVIAHVERQAMKLMQDPYGNYVVQYVLDACTADEAYGVMTKPLGHLFDLSIQKFSSNVIEKCLEKASEHVRHLYVAEMTHCPHLNRMLHDQFANYVVQRALCVCAEDDCRVLVQAICPYLAAMKNTSGGRRITARILKRFPTLDIGVDGVPLYAEGFGEPGGNSIMLGHLKGDYMHVHAGQSALMYGMRGHSVLQARDTHLDTSDGHLLVLDDVATRRV